MTGQAPRPYTLVAELTYRCPLACAYCSNPTSAPTDELDTTGWRRAVEEAAALGVLQLHLTGGEPLLRGDLEAIAAAARACGLYVTLVTGGVPLTARRLERLRDAGVAHVQLSVQDADARGDALAGAPVFEKKVAVAALVRTLGLPLTLNVVLHRGNIARVPELIALAERVGAARLELANVRLLGWALRSRAALLPSRALLDVARAQVRAARVRLAGRIEVVFALPDYHAGRPRACLGGWARRTIVVSPDGRVLPCHQAHTIPHLTFERVGERPLAAIWRDGEALRVFRGHAWMPEPCRSCDEREADFGGCRCQAFHLTGDAAATDPACARAPTHALVEAAVRDAAPGPLVPRRLRVVS